MEAFTRDGVVSDVLESVPAVCLNVKYGDVQLSPGCTLTPTQVKAQPMIGYEAKQGEVYTLIMSDPDAPSQADPKFKEILHWLVMNIQGNDVSSGEEKVNYKGSGAPKGTGLHRYIFQLYKQTDGQMDISGIASVNNATAEGRRNFNSKEFSKKHRLELVAANFFNAEWDESVPALHAQLGLKPRSYYDKLLG